jgi:hypothetical protein
MGKASRDFAARNGRIEIIEGHQLKSMPLGAPRARRTDRPAQAATPLDLSP